MSKKDGACSKLTVAALVISSITLVITVINLLLSFTK